MNKNFFFLVGLLCVISLGFSIVPSKYIRINSHSELKYLVDQNIITEGEVTDEVSQSMTLNTPEYPITNYFILRDNNRILVYSKARITPGKVKIYGTVVEATGLAKGPDPREEYSEYHINVDKWDSLK